jgi:hypothetical protein
MANYLERRKAVVAAAPPMRKSRRRSAPRASGQVVGPDTARVAQD